MFHEKYALIGLVMCKIIKMYYILTISWLKHPDSTPMIEKLNPKPSYTNEMNSYKVVWLYDGIIFLEVAFKFENECRWYWNTTITAWKLIPHRSKNSKNWNPPRWVPLHRFLKNWFLLIQKQLYSNYIQTNFTW